MNSTSSSPAIAISMLSATQSNQTNRYGEPTQSQNPDVRMPIEEKLNNSLKGVMHRAWQVGGASILLAGIGFLWMYFSTTPVIGPKATTLSVSVLAVSITASTLAAIGIISGGIIATLVGKQTEEIEQMQSGNYLARWDLAQEQWTKYIEDEKRKSNEDVSTAIFVLVFMGLLMWYPFSGVFSPFVCVSGILGLGLLGYLLGLCIVFVKKFRLQRMACPQFTVIGHHGLYFRNGYHPYSSFGTGLSSVEYQSTDAMEYLVFTFFNQTNNGRTEHERRVPIPFGKELEAKRVLQQFA